MWLRGNEISKTNSKKLLEIELLAKINHPNIIKFEDHISDNIRNEILIVFEFCPDGDLERVINIWKTENKYYSTNSSHTNLLLNWLTQLASAINYLHTYNPKIMHRDVIILEYSEYYSPLIIP